MSISMRVGFWSLVSLMVFKCVGQLKGEWWAGSIKGEWWAGIIKKPGTASREWLAWC
jgi:hypothetical protein